jgi:hypothetical protein
MPTEIECAVFLAILAGLAVSIVAVGSLFAHFLKSKTRDLARTKNALGAAVFLAVFTLAVTAMCVTYVQHKDLQRVYKRGNTWVRLLVVGLGLGVIPVWVAKSAKTLSENAIVSRYKVVVRDKTLLVDRESGRFFGPGTHYTAAKDTVVVELTEVPQYVVTELNGAGMVRWIPDVDNIFPFIALGHDGVRQKVQQVFMAEEYPDLQEYQPSLGVVFTKNSVQRPSPETLDIRSQLQDVEAKAQVIKEIEAAREAMLALLEGSPIAVIKRVNRLFDDLIANVMGVR